jgi:hypothetical protein
VSAATATSAEDFGGLEGLVEAAQEEGKLNVIALPPDWTNYGEIISTFSEKYGIEVVSAQPDANSQDEINAAKQLKGTDRAPDVFDLGPAVAIANADLFAPYKVETWDDIPDELKDPDGRYFSDYGGLMSIGYDAGAVPAPTSLADLLKPEYKGKVALNGDPTQAGAAFAGVVMASLANGGSADDIAPGVEFFAQLKDAGNFLPVDPTPATIASGQTPVGHRLGLHQRRSGRGPGRQAGVEGRRARGGRARLLLHAGDQRRRSAPGRRPAVAGVPLLRRGPEPVAQGLRPAGARGRHGRGRHARRGGVRQAAPGRGRAGQPHRGAGSQGQGVPRGQLAGGDQLSAGGRRALLLPALGIVPFLLYVGVFLLYPTLVVVGGAFVDDTGSPTLANLRTAVSGPYLQAFVRSLQLSAITAVIGAVLGALLAWAVVTGRPDGRCAAW